MSKHFQISAKQCKRARSLLHWNIQDISSRCNITRVRIEQFERGDVPLTRVESDLLLKIFTKNGILINTHGDVLMREDAKEVTQAAAQETNSYIVNDQTFTSESTNPRKAAEEEEERKRKLEANQQPAPRK